MVDNVNAGERFGKYVGVHLSEVVLCMALGNMWDGSVVILHAQNLVSFPRQSLQKIRPRACFKGFSLTGIHLSHPILEVALFIQDVLPEMSGNQLQQFLRLCHS